MILDDFTDENGTLEIFNKDDGEKVRVYPKAGDVAAHMEIHLINQNQIIQKNLVVYILCLQ